MRSAPSTVWLLIAASLLATAGCDSVDDAGPARLRAVNAAPGVSSIDLLVNGNLVAGNLDFREASPYVQVDAGVALVETQVTDGGVNVRFPFQVQMVEEQAYTGIITGAADALAIVVVQDDRLTPASGTARVSLVHTAPAAGPVAVDLLDADGHTVAEEDALPYAGASPYVDLDAGSYDVVVSENGATDTPVRLTTTFQTGRVYRVALIRRSGTFDIVSVPD